ncbi:MAG: Alpha/Beta hydrolase protein [Benjaminiella poitrasii]|nr:MAG: Alpha/Beta hydrolase protein [Benjaminiella poitrasii]
MKSDCFLHHVDEIKQQRQSDVQPEKPKGLRNRLIYQLFRHKNRNRQSSGYWRYAVGVYQNLFLMFYFNWTSIITSPISSIAFLTIYPIVAFILFIFEISLKFFMDFLGGSKWVKRLSERYGHGFSMTNWGAPQLLLSSESQRLIQSTLPALGTPCDRCNMDETTESRHRTFNLSIAETMTILSSLMYERQDELVTKAHETWSKTKDEEETKRQMWESEATIRTIAATYGLQFEGVTELKSLGGPFCGLYWSDSTLTPFIIVAFKGTTPTNYSEFLVDATFQRTDARPFLFGATHEGFYDALFSTSADADTTAHDPYYAIVRAVRSRASSLVASTNGVVQVWVTGHSLGAAMASLLFARWLKSPHDLAQCELRDAYLLGSPAVGDHDFASLFASHVQLPLARTSVLWRLVHQADIVARVPPGYNNATVGHYVQSMDFFNYSHVGHAVHLAWSWARRPLYIYPSSYESNLKVDVVVGESKRGKEEEERKKSPIDVIESMYPFFIHDHLPYGYFKGLERARAYYNTLRRKEEKHV